jgi:hypothetical protein
MDKTSFEISFSKRQSKVIAEKAESLGMTVREWLEFTIIRKIAETLSNDYLDEKMWEEFGVKHSIREDKSE